MKKKPTYTDLENKIEKLETLGAEETEEKK